MANYGDWQNNPGFYVPDLTPLHLSTAKRKDKNEWFGHERKAWDEKNKADELARVNERTASNLAKTGMAQAGMVDSGQTERVKINAGASIAQQEVANKGGLAVAGIGEGRYQREEEDRRKQAYMNFMQANTSPTISKDGIVLAPPRYSTMEDAHKAFSEMEKNYSGISGDKGGGLPGAAGNKSSGMRRTTGPSGNATFTNYPQPSLSAMGIPNETAPSHAKPSQVPTANPADTQPVGMAGPANQSLSTFNKVGTALSEWNQRRQAASDRIGDSWLTSYLRDKARKFDERTTNSYGLSGR